MRERAYSLFEIVAWPALAWCVFEVGLRAATGATSGVTASATTAAAAGATIVASRWRKRELTTAPATLPDD